MSGYTKLFSSIVTSTIWRESDHVRLVWVTMLALADQHGVIEASVPGLADMARVSRSLCEDALRVLSSPDPDSRTKDADGRRIEECDGGWKLINHRKYREKMSDADRRARRASYMRQYRRKADGVTDSVTDRNSMLLDVTEVAHTDQKQNRTEAETEIRIAPRFTPSSLLAIWGKSKTVASNKPEWGGSAGISPEKARTAADMLSASEYSEQDVAASMATFWADVKSKRNKDHEKIQKNNPFAFGCWFAMAPAYLAVKAVTQVESREEERRSRPLARIPGT